MSDSVKLTVTMEMAEAALRSWLNDGWIKDGLAEFRDQFGEQRVQYELRHMKQAVEAALILVDTEASRAAFHQEPPR